MLYVVTLVVISIWMIAVLRSKKLSVHSVVNAYAIGVFCADIFEVTFDLLMELYQFSPQLHANPIHDNELGIIFGDTIILPFTFIVFVYYAAGSKHPWKISLPFALSLILIEWIYIRLGYMQYLHWNLAFSSIFYFSAFFIGICLARRIASYHPPVPYWFRLFCFSHMIIMWVGAIFASPLLKMFQFKPGIYQNFMADCRFTDLLSGDILAILCTILSPFAARKWKPLLFAVIAFIGISFAMYAYRKGWLIYYRWNHILMALRYLIPLALIMIYDRWESTFNEEKRALQI